MILIEIYENMKPGYKQSKSGVSFSYTISTHTLSWVTKKNSDIAWR